MARRVKEIKMNLALLAESTTIDLIEVVDSNALEYQQYLVAKFEKAVNEQRILIEDENLPVLHLPTSFGKDSFTQLLITLEAYKRSIAEGKVENTRPLIVNTVNTLVESLPMVMFTRYAAKRLIAYAKANNINLYFDFVSPPLMDEYFIRWASGQKLIPSILRSGDCSVVLKVNPSETYAAEVMDKITSVPKMKMYASSPRITCVGSRDDESSRRATNIRAQKLDANVNEVKANLTPINASKSSKPQYKYAPIREWLTQEVFDFLALSGTSPVMRSLMTGNPAPIPSFLNSGALLLEIYGNGSNEVCELVVGQKNTGSGCNGKARFGCWSCTLSGTDKSSTAISDYERWRVLGSEYALRVRDYLYRIGHDNSKRAFHARAYDPVAYNRVLLQPNVLKSKYLEKMVWYASQLAQYSQNVAREFSIMVKEGREQDFSGYREIMNDQLMNPQAKLEFLDMYREEAQRPLIECFSQKHAVMLSVRWSLDGINSAPFRPLAIWTKVKLGESLPWPKTMAEYESVTGKKFVMDKVLPDALAIPTIQEKKFTPQSFAQAEMDLYSMYDMPVHYSQIFEENMNCSMQNLPRNTQEITVEYQAKLGLTHNKSSSIIGSITPYSNAKKCLKTIFITLDSLDITKARLGTRTLSKTFLDFLKSDIQQEIESRLVDLADGLENNMSQYGFSDNDYARAFVEKGIAAMQSQTTVKLNLPYIDQVPVDGLMPRQTPVNVERKFASTLRVVKRNKSKIIHTNTRLRTYSAHLSPRYERSALEASEIMKVNFDTHYHYTLPVDDDPARLTGELSSLGNISFNLDQYAMWVENELDKALYLHDCTVRSWVKHRRGVRSYNFRRYGGSYVAETMFRTGGMFVQKSYSKQLAAILQRTHLFAEIGAFNFANMTYEQLINSDVCIPMKSHRSDKAKVLLAIRDIRNERRISARRTVSENELITPVINGVEQLFGEMRVALHFSLKHGMEGRLNCVFFDNTVSLINRSSAYRNWLRHYSDMLSDVNSLLQGLFGRNGLTQLQNTNKLLPVAKAIGPIIQPVVNEGNEQLTKYRSKLCKLQYLKQAYSTENGLDITWLRLQWAQLMTEIHDDPEEYIAFFPESKRNEENLLKLLDRNISFLEIECDFHDQLLSSCQQLIDKASQSAIQKLSFNDRLAAMSKLTKMVA